MANTGTVFVVEDDKSLREGIVSLLRSVGQTVAAFGTVEDFMRVRDAAQPGCLVLDVRLPDTSGLELQKRLASMGDRVPVVFITGHGDVPMSVQTLKAGAVDFLLKPFRDQDLLESVQAALRQDCVQREAESQAAEGLASYRSLTQREREIMKLVVTGQINKQIAGMLGLSEVTVKIHRAQVMRKMGASSLADLVRIADKLAIFPEYNEPAQSLRSEYSRADRNG
jgi:FixJ family two-component response regulator